MNRIAPIAATIALGLGLAAVEGEAAVRARSLGAWVNVPEYGAVNRLVCDTDWLPVTGGLQTATALEYVAGTALTMQHGTATVHHDDDCDDGDDDDDFAKIELGPTVLMPSYVSETSFTALYDRDDDECCEGDDDDFTPAVIENLYFNGELVVVTGLPNQIIEVPGVGRLIINEIDDGGRDDDDCDDDDFAVNALHLYPATGGEIIVGSTIYDRDEDCCQTPTTRRSWGRVKTIYR